MVSLYKDPDGVCVFVAHEEAMTAETTLQCERHDGLDMDALRQRIKQLEDELMKHSAVHKTSLYVCRYSMYFANKIPSACA